MLDYHNIQNLYLSNDTLYVSIYGRGVRIISATNGKVIATIPLNTIEGKSIFKTQNGTLIFALEEGGCAIMCPGQKLKRPEALSGRPISDMTESASGTIWFATHAYGLYCLYPNGEWQHFSDISNKIDINNLSCLLYNREKNDLWIGTKEKGVIVFNIAQKKIKNIFNLENGMPSDIIYSIIDDKYGNIWISTPKGLAQIVQNSTTEYIKTILDKRYNTTLDAPYVDLPACSISEARMDLFQLTHRNLQKITSLLLYISPVSKFSMKNYL